MKKEKLIILVFIFSLTILNILPNDVTQYVNLAVNPAINLMGNTEPVNLKSLSYILKVQFPKHIENISPICGYYKGYRIEFIKDISIIKESVPNNQFILVITPEVKQKTDGINIKHLERIAENDCRLFYINQNSEHEKNSQDYWIIEEEKKDNLPVRLPEEAIVLLMDPNLIDNLQYKNNQYRDQVDCKDVSNIINLPDIIIKQNVTQEQINKSSIYSILAALDPNAYHLPLKKASKKERDIQVSMQLLPR